MRQFYPSDVCFDWEKIYLCRNIYDMKVPYLHLFGTMCLTMFISCSSPLVEVGDLKVIPLPQYVTQQAAENPFVVTRQTSITYPEGNEKLQKTAELLSSYIEEVTDICPKVRTGATASHGIALSVSEEIKEKEGYQLTVSETGIQLKGGSEAGVFHGIQTLFKALPIVKGTDCLAAIPSGVVEDYPRFPYRGFMVDVGRHYFPVSYLKQLIDLMALHNINYFHWHLTEDQGWRIEIKKYPKLTEIGSVRDSTLIDRVTREYDGVPHSGFYTQEEAREIVQYAAERFITVIPEIDMPGHMMAALASYPELGCTGGPYQIPCQFGVYPEVLCAGNEETLQFAKDVIAEILAIFPSEYIHIGGDECPKRRWRECPKCQAKIRELGLKDTPEHSKENQLQTYFMGEMEQFLNAQGRKVLGWNEILEGGLTDNITVMSWTGTEGGIEAARQHHPVIMTPIQFLYFSNPNWNKLESINRVKRVYYFEPVPEELTDEEKTYIIGAQACMWTEWTADSLKMEEQVLPRMAALSEIQWTMPEQKDFEDFKKRLPALLEKYTLRGYDYKKDIHDTSIVEMPADSLKKKSLKL